MTAETAAEAVRRNRPTCADEAGQEERKITMKKNDYVFTPRFCTVKIQKVFASEINARKAGFTEPTHYEGAFGILGKSIGTNRMIFAAHRK